MSVLSAGSSGGRAIFDVSEARSMAASCPLNRTRISHGRSLCPSINGVCLSTFVTLAWKSASAASPCSGALTHRAIAARPSAPKPIAADFLSMIIVYSLLTYEYAAVALAQSRFLHLAGASHGQGVEKYNLIRDPPLDHLPREEREDFLPFEIVFRFAHDEQQGPLFPARMLDADDRRHGHGEVTDGHIFQVNQTDPFPAGLDQILGPISDLDRALVVDGGNVAGREPPIDERRGIRFVVTL